MTEHKDDLHVLLSSDSFIYTNSELKLRYFYRTTDLTKILDTVFQEIRNFSSFDNLTDDWILQKCGGINMNRSLNDLSSQECVDTYNKLFDIYEVCRTFINRETPYCLLKSIYDDPNDYIIEMSKVFVLELKDHDNTINLEESDIECYYTPDNKIVKSKLGCCIDHKLCFIITKLKEFNCCRVKLRRLSNWEFDINLPTNLIY